MIVLTIHQGLTFWCSLKLHFREQMCCEILHKQSIQKETREFINRRVEKGRRKHLIFLGTKLEGHFFIRPEGPFPKIKRAFLCHSQNLCGTHALSAPWFLHPIHHAGYDWRTYSQICDFSRIHEVWISLSRMERVEHWVFRNKNSFGSSSLKSCQ